MNPFVYTLMALAIVTVLSFTGTLCGQTVQGVVTGSVTDSEGAVIVNAELTLTNDGTRVAQSQKSHADGAFRFPLVPPGTCSSETVAALRSLGYFAGPAGPGREPGVDPKDRIGDFERYFSALSLASAGRREESIRLLENLRDKLPGVAEIQINLGLNHKRLAQYGAAAREFKRAAELAPADAQAHYELGSCYFQLRQLNEAIQELNAALAAEPWYTLADEALAEIYIQKQDYTQARAHLNHILSIDPRSYTANYNLGVFAAIEKNWSEAEQRMLVALDVDPDSAEAKDTLGGVYFERGELQRARQHFEKALRLQPKSGSAHYHLGLVLQRQGRTAEAEQEFRAAQQAAHLAGAARCFRCRLEAAAAAGDTGLYCAFKLTSKLKPHSLQSIAPIQASTGDELAAVILGEREDRTRGGGRQSAEVVVYSHPASGVIGVNPN